MDVFGPDIEKYEEVQSELDRIAIAEAEMETLKVTVINASNSVPVDKSKAKKRKDRRGEIYRIQIPISIMESIGVPCSEIRRFENPWHWLTYFPPLAVVSFLICL
jgi:leucyl-tRNA synthetase